MGFFSHSPNYLEKFTRECQEDSYLLTFMKHAVSILFRDFWKKITGFLARHQCDQCDNCTAIHSDTTHTYQSQSSMPPMPLCPPNMKTPPHTLNKNNWICLEESLKQSHDSGPKPHTKSTLGIECHFKTCLKKKNFSKYHNHRLPTSRWQQEVSLYCN